jgi:hypothetical protein
VLTTQIQDHFRYGSLQRATAQAALDQVQREHGPIADTHVRDWLRALWRDGERGPVSSEVAAKALRLFAERPISTTTIEGAPAPFKAGAGGMMIQSWAKDDGKDWRLSIDQASVEAKVATATADLEWLLSLDLRKPDDYRAFGQWAGWKVADATYQSGASWSNDMIHGWIISALQSRHRIPRPFARPFIEDLTDAQKAKWIPQKLVEAAKAAHAREAVFDAFLAAKPLLNERIAFGRLDEETLRHQLEDALGLPRGRISPRDFNLMLDEKWEAGGLPDPKEVGYTREIFSDHVLQDVSANRITHALIDTGLHEQRIDDEAKLQRLEDYFGVPRGGISLREFVDASSRGRIEHIAGSREKYGR